jgi:hypothetical protein
MNTYPVLLCVLCLIVAMLFFFSFRPFVLGHPFEAQGPNEFKSQLYETKVTAPALIDVYLGALRRSLPYLPKASITHSAADPSSRDRFRIYSLGSIPLRWLLF